MLVYDQNNRPPLGAEPNKDHVYQNNLLSLLLFNEGEGGKTRDLVGNNIYRTLGSFGYTSAYGSSGLGYGGIKSNTMSGGLACNYIDFGQKGWFRLTGSFNCRIKILNNQDGNGAYLFGSDASTGQGLTPYVRLYYNTSRTLSVTVGSNYSGLTATHPVNLPLGQWITIGFTMTSTGTTSTIKLFVNGVNSATATGSHTDINGTDKYVSILSLDYYKPSNYRLGPLEGIMDHCRIYSTTLPDAYMIQLQMNPFADFNMPNKGVLYYVVPTFIQKSWVRIIG